jgi:GNAT superfamily N-acetyltransferase
MIDLADRVFHARADPDQLSVDEDVLRSLRLLHPAAVCEERDTEGPIAWALLFPTLSELMERFLRGEITERELLDLTPVGSSYDVLYLCSALVLPEHRRQGLARGLLTRAVRAIREDHPLTMLFFWAFSEEGAHLAQAVAEELKMPLRERKV